MNTFINLLNESNFQRTNIPINPNQPLVVHAVAGAGKSTLIRKYLHLNPKAKAFTHGVPDEPNLTTTYIHSYRQPDPECFNILDEYCAQPLTEGWDVVLADPLQHKQQPLRPHYIKTISHRIPGEFQQLLTDQGFHLEAQGPTGKLTTGSIFNSTLHGKVLHLDPLARDLLKTHGCPSSCPVEVIGQEFPVVTLVSGIPLKQVHPRPKLYLALTRTFQSLHVLSPDYPD